MASNVDFKQELTACISSVFIPFFSLPHFLVTPYLPYTRQHHQTKKECLLRCSIRDLPPLKLPSLLLALLIVYILASYPLVKKERRHG